MLFPSRIGLNESCVCLDPDHVSISLYFSCFSPFGKSLINLALTLVPILLNSSKIFMWNIPFPYSRWQASYVQGTMPVTCSCRYIYVENNLGTSACNETEIIFSSALWFSYRLVYHLRIYMTLSSISRWLSTKCLPSTLCNPCCPVLSTPEIASGSSVGFCPFNGKMPTCRATINGSAKRLAENIACPHEC